MSMATEQDDFTMELERALRRVRSTGDIDIERPSRQRATIRVHHSTGQRAIRIAQLDDNDTPQRRLSTPATARTRDAPTRTLPIPAIPIDTPPSPPLTPRIRPPRPVPPGFRGKVMVLFGLAGPNAKARSRSIAIVWKMAFAFVHEWQACSKPLGAWDCIWLVRVALGCGMGYWDWRRNLTLDRIGRGESAPGDTEAGRASTGATNRRNSNLTSTTNAQGSNNNVQTETPLPHTHAFRRLNILANTLSMVWFLAAHIFVYSSVNTCRHSSPHLWWLTFGILCILYLMLLEIFLIGLLIFILGPILYLFYNIVLLCLGRHPLQRVGEVHADIKKIPKSVVDKIPLVLYIPPPPEDESVAKDETSPIAAPSPAHLYPPKPSVKSTERKRKFKFAFLRRSKLSGSATRRNASKSKVEGSSDEVQTWEDNWVPGDYPFVRLEGHRAACAICLMDFDEPERKDKCALSVPPATQTEEKPEHEEPSTSAQPTLGTVQEVQVEEVTLADAERLKLEDAGEGSQPLRLLACGRD
ncbi:hypothetical protein BDY19DRAFT_398510 [Irpex rosettiformis]|uniref:Uncharacterized protein n=1 Tax=Irpex rosettiformis TaxID=378272 RepID=A0ACB8UFZ4_9APHY|nr:hypothetical protein BDY19DRAFT_398510 [Irpex rosettiformis]